MPKPLRPSFRGCFRGLSEAETRADTLGAAAREPTKEPRRACRSFTFSAAEQLSEPKASQKEPAAAKSGRVRSSGGLRPGSAAAPWARKAAQKLIV